MRNIRLYFPMLIGAFMNLAVAQTCSSPNQWMPQQSGEPGQSADLCSASDEVALYCDFLDSASKNDVIWQYNIVNGFTATSITVSGAAAGFNPVVYMYAGACAEGHDCFQTGDSNSPLQLSGAPEGSFFLAVSAAPSDASGACGVITLHTNGWLPVALQKFSVE